MFLAVMAALCPCGGFKSGSRSSSLTPESATIFFIAAAMS